MVAAIPSSVAAVLHGKHDLRIEPRPQLLPPPGHAQVRIMATTLCGSDCTFDPYSLFPVTDPHSPPSRPLVHYYLSGANGTFALQHSMCLGHEAAGIITALGPDAPSHLQIGTRVAIECGIPCSEDTCARCSEGRYNLCPEMRFCSSAKTAPHLDGTLQTFMNHPYKWLHALPQRITYEQAALAEPLGVVLHASRRAAFTAGSSVLVLGAGAVGLLACALARAQGAAHVVCVDVNQARLEFAVRAGFVDHTLNTAAPAFTTPTPTAKVSTPRNPAHNKQKLPFQDDMDRSKSIADRILALSPLDQTVGGFDVVFECTGAESCIQTAIYVRLFSFLFPHPPSPSPSRNLIPIPSPPDP